MVTYIMNMLTAFLNDQFSNLKHFSPVRIFIELTFKLKVSYQSHLYEKFMPTPGFVVQGSGATFQT